MASGERTGRRIETRPGDGRRCSRRKLKKRKTPAESLAGFLLTGMLALTLGRGLDCGGSGFACKQGSSERCSLENNGCLRHWNSSNEAIGGINSGLTQDVYNTTEPIKYLKSKMWGGEHALPDRFPYIASLKNELGIHFCTGFLIGTKWVLTAAHCVYGIEEHPTVHIGVGRTNEVAMSKVKQSCKTYIHPLFNGDSRFGFDLALLKLTSEVYIPVPILKTNSIFGGPGTNVLALGWGSSQSNSNQESQWLHMASNLEIMERKSCRGVRDLKVHMLCVYSDEANTCPGDSGGPVLIPHMVNGYLDNGRPELDLIVGITSFGPNCEEHRIAGVYTNISYFEPWINVVTSSQHNGQTPVESGMQSILDNFMLLKIALIPYFFVAIVTGTIGFITGAVYFGHVKQQTIAASRSNKNLTVQGYLGRKDSKCGQPTNNGQLCHRTSIDRITIGKYDNEMLKQVKHGCSDKITFSFLTSDGALCKKGEFVDVMDEVIGLSPRSIIKKGQLHNGCAVAVKFSWTSTLEREQKCLEAALFNDHQPEQLVKVISASIKPDTGEGLLVMESMSCSLNDLLKDPLCSMEFENETLLKIFINVVDGLSYLHERKLPIAHRALKLSNILLNVEKGKIVSAKLSDIGFAKQTTMDLRCTMNMDATGRVRNEFFRNLYRSVKKPDKKSFTGELYDVRCLGDVIHKCTVAKNTPNEVVELAQRCRNATPDDKPSLEEIKANLENILDSGWSKMKVEKNLKDFIEHMNSTPLAVKINDFMECKMTYHDFLRVFESLLKQMKDEYNLGNKISLKPENVLLRRVGENIVATIQTKQCNSSFSETEGINTLGDVMSKILQAASTKEEYTQKLSKLVLRCCHPVPHCKIRNHLQDFDSALGEVQELVNKPWTKSTLWPCDFRPLKERYCKHTDTIDTIQFKTLDEEDCVVAILKKLVGKASAGNIYEGCCWRIRQIVDSAAGDRERVTVKKYKMRADFHETDDLVKAFKSECAIFAKVKKHPNIVTCYGFPQDYIVEEYMENGNLNDLIYSKDAAVLTYGILVNIFLQIARGLDHLYSSKVVHYDLTPTNILLKPNPDKGAKKHEKFIAKVSDFGISEWRVQTYLTGKMRGTLLYMAPELIEAAMSNSRVNVKKLDVYSFGVVMWECVGGPVGDSMLPKGGDTLTIFSQTSCPKEVPDELRNFIQTCLRREKRERPDWKEIAEILEQMQNSEWVDYLVARPAR